MRAGPGAGHTSIAISVPTGTALSVANSVPVPGVAGLPSRPRMGCKFIFLAWGGSGGRRGHAGFGGFCFFTGEMLLCLLEQGLLLGSTTPLELTLERLSRGEELGWRPGTWM